MAEAGPRPCGDASDEELIERMRAADREAAALYLLRCRNDLEGWIGKNAKGLAAASSDDVLSTLLRRFDRLVMTGRFRARDSAQTRSLLFAMARRALISIFRRHRSESEAMAGAVMEESIEHDPQDQSRDLGRIRSILAELDSSSYELLVWKLDGRDSTEIARMVGSTPEAVRQRWRLLRARLLRAIEPSR